MRAQKFAEFTKFFTVLTTVFFLLSACNPPSRFASLDAKTEDAVDPPQPIAAGYTKAKFRSSIATEKPSTVKSSRRSSKRPLTNSELGQWRLQQASVFAEQDPNRRPRRLPKPFHAVSWNNFLPLFPQGTNATLTSDFGWRNKYGRIDFHPAVDIAASAGTPVRSPVTGTVLRVNRGNAEQSGLVILSGERQYTLWHIDVTPNLRRGVIVEKDQLVGHLSQWGKRSHLHFSVHLTGRSANSKKRNDHNSVDPISTTWRARHNNIDLFAASVTDGRGILRLDDTIAQRFGF